MLNYALTLHTAEAAICVEKLLQTNVKMITRYDTHVIMKEKEDDLENFLYSKINLTDNDVEID